MSPGHQDAVDLVAELLDAVHALDRALSRLRMRWPCSERTTLAARSTPE